MNMQYDITNTMKIIGIRYANIAFPFLSSSLSRYQLITQDKCHDPTARPRTATDQLKSVHNSHNLNIISHKII